LDGLKRLVEYKEPLSVITDPAAPTILKNVREYERASTESTLALSSVLFDMFKGHEYSFSLSTSVNMSSSGGGIVNSTVSNSLLASNAAFASLAGVFNEFFVERMRLVWQPVGRYNGPIGSAPATNATSLPIGLCSLQHGASAYSSLALMSENFKFAYANTSDPFEYTWINVEDFRIPTAPVLVVSTPGQSWMLVRDVAQYQGTVQIISGSAPPALPVSQVLGAFVVEHLVRFRIRE